MARSTLMPECVRLTCRSATEPLAPVCYALQRTLTTLPEYRALDAALHPAHHQVGRRAGARPQARADGARYADEVPVQGHGGAGRVGRQRMRGPAQLAREGALVEGPSELIVAADGGRGARRDRAGDDGSSTGVAARPCTARSYSSGARCTVRAGQRTKGRRMSASATSAMAAAEGAPHQIRSQSSEEEAEAGEGEA